MQKVKILTAISLLAAVIPAAALEIDPNVVPEITLGGRLIATTDYEVEQPIAGSRESDAGLNVADSSLLFGFSKYLFDDQRYGFAVIGFKLPDDDTDLRDDLYIHEAHVGIGGPRYEVKLGRSRLGNTLIQFPTLRDDDLLEYAYVPNGSANAEAEEYQQFGNIAAASWWLTPTVQIDTGITGRTVTDAAGNRETTGDFNGGYLGIAYSIPEAIKIDPGLRYAGLRIDTQDARVTGLGLPKQSLTALIGAVSLNLNENPEATWNFDLQAILNDGADVPNLATQAGRARAKSRAVVAALRYGERPALQTRWQAALNLAWKDYADFGNASSYSVVPSYVYRLGSGIDFLAQYRYTRYDAMLAAAIGHEREHVVQVGLQFAFDHTFNESVGERGSILNLEHNTLDLGPTGGGH
jgi:Gram-negative porin